MFLWRFPSGYPAWALPSTLPVRSSDFPLRRIGAATQPTGPRIHSSRGERWTSESLEKRVAEGDGRHLRRETSRKGDDPG